MNIQRTENKINKKLNLLGFENFIVIGQNGAIGGYFPVTIYNSDGDLIFKFMSRPEEFKNLLKRVIKNIRAKESQIAYREGEENIKAQLKKLVG